MKGHRSPDEVRKEQWRALDIEARKAMLEHSPRRFCDRAMVVRDTEIRDSAVDSSGTKRNGLNLLRALEVYTGSWEGERLFADRMVVEKYTWHASTNILGFPGLSWDIRKGGYAAFQLSLTSFNSATGWSCC